MSANIICQIIPINHPNNNFKNNEIFFKKNKIKYNYKIKYKIIIFLFRKIFKIKTFKEISHKFFKAN